MAQKRNTISVVDRIKSRIPHVDVRDFFAGLKQRPQYKQGVAYMQRKPFTAFLIGLAILFGVIALGNFIDGLNQKEETHEQAVKTVETYALNGNPSVTVQAKVDKEGVIQILAQSPGIVQSVNFVEGEEVHPGHVFVNLASNYSGGNAPALQASLAQATYDNTNATYGSQRELIQKQREVADKTEANSEEMRKIASESANSTRSLIDLNRGTIETLNEQIRIAEEAGNVEQIVALEQQRNQVQSGVLQLETQLRSLDYQRNGNNPAGELGVLQRDIAKKQLDIQEKALELGLTTSRIQRDLAWVQASLMAPASPCRGIIEKIFVKPGDSVNPGDPIATIKTNNDQAMLEALIPSDIAFSVSRTASSSATINGKTVKMEPFYVSREATDGQLYSVLFNLPEENTSSVTNGQYLPITIPLGVETAQAYPYVPLDAIYQTQNEAYVFIAQGNKAVSKKVTLGDVFGKFVLVTDGLSSNDNIILNRNIVSGETVKISN